MMRLGVMKPEMAANPFVPENSKMLIEKGIVSTRFVIEFARADQRARNTMICRVGARTLFFLALVFQCWRFSLSLLRKGIYVAVFARQVCSEPAYSISLQYLENKKIARFLEGNSASDDNPATTQVSLGMGAWMHSPSLSAA